MSRLAFQAMRLQLSETRCGRWDLVELDAEQGCPAAESAHNAASLLMAVSTPPYDRCHV